MKKNIVYILFLFLIFSGLFAQDWSYDTKLISPNRTRMDFFGLDVDIDGDRVIIGAFNEGEDENNDQSLEGLGAAYIYKKSANGWILEQRLVPSNSQLSDYFGYSVAISGNYAVVGAHGQNYDEHGQNYIDRAGAAYIYYFDGSKWIQQEKIVAPQRAAMDYFGFSVSISGDNIMIGAYGDDDDENGLNPMSSSGCAYIFSHNDSGWTQQQKLVASDRSLETCFGFAVDISGAYAISGSLFSNVNPDNPSASKGAAYIFHLNEATWVSEQKIMSTTLEYGDCFGSEVAISGDNAIVGSLYINQNAGAAYIFSHQSSGWREVQKLTAPVQTVDDYFSCSVDIEGDIAVVGAFKEDEDADGLNPIEDAGAVYIFSNNENIWTLDTCLVAPERNLNDYFGSVAISGENLIVGAYMEDEDEDEEHTVTNAGAAYIFKHRVPLDVKEMDLPQTFALKNIYPNPFNPSTTISFELPFSDYMELDIYDLSGKCVTTLYKGKHQAGSYELNWNANNIPSGIYVIRMCSGSFLASRKIALIK